MNSKRLAAQGAERSCPCIQGALADPPKLSSTVVTGKITLRQITRKLEERPVNLTMIKVRGPAFSFPCWFGGGVYIIFFEFRRHFQKMAHAAGLGQDFSPNDIRTLGHHDEVWVKALSVNKALSRKILNNVKS